MLPIKNRKSRPAKKRKPKFRFGPGWPGSYYADRPFLIDFGVKSNVQRPAATLRRNKYKPAPKPVRFCEGCQATEFNKVFSAPMLRDELWASLGLTKKQVMCFECIEAKLERQLTVDDIMPDSPMYAGVIQMLRRASCQPSSN